MSSHQRQFFLCGSQLLHCTAEGAGRLFQIVGARVPRKNIQQGDVSVVGVDKQLGRCEIVVLSLLHGAEGPSLS